MLKDNILERLVLDGVIMTEVIVTAASIRKTVDGKILFDA